MFSNANTVQIVLKYTFGILPIAAGIDKFLNILTDWSHYLVPWVENLLPLSADGTMMVVGIIEIIAGILVWSKTKIGAYIVSVWLLVIALSLIFSGQHTDVAVRDIVMAVSAYCLALLSHND